MDTIPSTSIQLRYLKPHLKQCGIIQHANLSTNKPLWSLYYMSREAKINSSTKQPTNKNFQYSLPNKALNQDRVLDTKSKGVLFFKDPKQNSIKKNNNCDEEWQGIHKDTNFQLQVVIFFNKKTHASKQSLFFEATHTPTSQFHVQKITPN
ncbi:hypothetical protein ACH5RR_035063 [Cinchona calisaya]|uniref:Uncharacterized protein n=1 Tax=Cinchona calisaya TaxID=153742 RepID=A0ABD2YFS0_9GENT